jgi:DNA polymerase III delta subunit
VQFWKLFENDFRNYVINAIKSKNFEINSEAVKLLIDLTGRDIKKVDEAIFKLLNSGEKLITVDIIRYMIPDTKEVSVFEFIDSLFQKSRNAFHDLVKILESDNNELMILKLIVRQAELIEKYLYLTNKNTSGSAALQEIGISQRNTDIFLKCVRNYTLSTIRDVFPVIHKADQSLKSYGYSGSISFNPLFDLVSSMLLHKA